MFNLWSAKLISSQLNPCIVRWAYSVSSARHLICLARISICQPILPAYKDPSEGQACRSVLPDPVNLVPTVRFLRVLFVPSSKSPMKMLNSISPVLKPVALSWPLVYKILTTTLWAWRCTKLLMQSTPPELGPNSAASNCIRAWLK